jgi:hypothetical protein
VSTGGKEQNGSRSGGGGVERTLKSRLLIRAFFCSSGHGQGGAGTVTAHAAKRSKSTCVQKLRAGIEFSVWHHCYAPRHMSIRDGMMKGEGGG